MSFVLGVPLTALDQDRSVQEESFWFGDSARPLFGRIAAPIGGVASGGVLISSPIGQESRQARRALRSLALYLAADGYVSLRFDHFGTGDSSGSLDEDEFDHAWIEGITQGSELLRSLGLASVSAVGMRLGATMIGAAASQHDLRLSSFVMWDPCESGRSYLREMRALGAISRNALATGTGETTKMEEYALNDEAASRLKKFSLLEPPSRPLAERVLIVSRSDRSVSSEFQTRWDSQHVEWASTSEQGPMLETLLHSTVQPATTIEQIRTWITAAPVVPTPFSMPSLPRDVVVKKGSNSFAIRETITELGPHQMFGIVAEPVGDTHGPLIAMINGVNEDHVGPARLWVELSRRWASMGLRCVRFDLSELGESPWLPGQPDRPIFDKTRSQDVSDAVRELLPEHSSEAVLIGYCSGAILAFEVALELKTRGVCAINPQVGSGVFLNVDRLDQTEGKSIRSVARRVEGLLENHQRIKKVIRPIARVVLTSKVSEKLVFNTLKLSSPCPPKVRSALVRNHTEILLLVSPEDLSSFRRIPIIGSFLRRRLASSDHFDVEIVPGLDHAFLSTVGRGRAVALLDQHIVEAFGP